MTFTVTPTDGSLPDPGLQNRLAVHPDDSKVDAAAKTEFQTSIDMQSAQACLNKCKVCQDEASGMGVPT